MNFERFAKSLSGVLEVSPSLEPQAMDSDSFVAPLLKQMTHFGARLDTSKKRLLFVTEKHDSRVELEELEPPVISAVHFDA